MATFSSSTIAAAQPHLHLYTSTTADDSEEMTKSHEEEDLSAHSNRLNLPLQTINLPQPQNLELNLFKKNIIQSMHQENLFMQKLPMQRLQIHIIRILIYIIHHLFEHLVPVE